MPKMSPSTLQAMLAAQHADALAASNASKLSSARSDAMSYYNGDVSKDMPAEAGRSSAVSMDVSDTVDGAMPQLVEVFAGTDEVVKFEPVGPEDVQAAEQETDYINHVFMNQNNGLLILHDFIKDALLSKVGIVKIWWETEEREQRETYYGKTEDEYALIVANPDVEVVEHSEHEAEQPDPVHGPDAGDLPGGNPLGAQAPQILHDITVVTKKTHAQARVMGVPPEEFGIEKGARSIRKCNYCFHKVVDRTESDLIEQGYDERQIKSLQTYRASTNTEETSRDTVDENSTAGSDEINTAARLVEVTEHYVRMDYDGKGKTSLYRVTTGGNQGEILIRDGKLDCEPFDAIPFAAMTPIIVTHRFYGRSLADMVMDIQRIKTALLRALLDNAYLANNPRSVVAENLASDNTLDDLLISRPGNIVRAKAQGAVEWQTVPTIGNHVYPLLEYQDQTKETRTGVSRRGQGLEPDALSNQSATAAKIVDNASQARIRLIARIFAETGIRDLFWLLHATIKKHAQQAAVVRLRNNWVTVDPRQWKSREDLTIHVGLGTGGKAQRLLELNLIAQAQEKLLLGGFSNIVGAKQLYSTGKEMTKALQMPNTDAFFADPTARGADGQLLNPPPPPTPDPKLLELQVKSQLEERALNLKAEIEKLQAQADIATQDRKTAAEIALAEKKFALDRELKLVDAQLAVEKHHVEMTQKDQAHGQALEIAKTKSEQSKTPKASIEVKHGADEIAGPIGHVITAMGKHLADHQAKHTELIISALNKPKRLVRDPKSGKALGVETVN